MKTPFLYMLLTSLLTYSFGVVCAQTQNVQTTNAVSRPSWKFAFDQPQTVWRLESNNVSVKKHVHLSDEGFSGRGCEYISIDIPTNTGSVMLGMKIGTGRLTEDVLPTINIKSDRTDLRFLLRVVLPMSRENVKSTSDGTGIGAGKPVSLLLTGGTYSSTGRWQELRIDRPLDVLKKQALELSQQRGQNLDITGAYFDMIYLDLNGGEGETNVWIDDLEITGFEEIDSTQILLQAQNRLDNPDNTIGQPTTSNTSPFPQPFISNQAGRDGVTPPLNVPGTQQTPAFSNSNTHENIINQFQVKIANDTILLNNERFFIRAVQYNEEPLEFIQQLGFNTVWLNRVPDAQFQATAESLGLWIVCPPPLTNDQKDVTSEDSYTKYTPIFWGQKYNRVLFWDLGNIDSQNLNAKQLDQLCQRIRECDRGVLRPILAQSAKDMINVSHRVDLMLISRNPIYSSLDFKGYLRWLRDIPNLIMTGMPRICVIPTQPDEQLVQQWHAMFPNVATPDVLSYEHMQLMAYAAAGMGNRGLLFESRKPLNNPDPDTQCRNRRLAALNTRLAVVDSFLAIGLDPMLINSQTDLNLWYVMINIPNRGRLLLPMYIPQNAQYVLSGLKKRNELFLIPNVPTTYQAYRLTSNGMEPITSSRQPGGLMIGINSQADSAMVLLARDMTVISSLSSRIKNYGPRATALTLELAKNNLDNFQQWFDKNKAGKEENILFDIAVKSLYKADNAYQQNLWAEVDSACSDSSNALRILEYSYWLSVVNSIQEPNWHPTAVSFRTMRLFYKWREQMQQYTIGDNLLPTGDFEFAKMLNEVGWSIHKENLSNEDITSVAQMCYQAAFMSPTGLRLYSTINVSEELQSEFSMLGTPPISVSTPVIQVKPYETVKITCMVKLPIPLKCSIDGLVIRDSFSGNALAQHVTKTLGWQPIMLFRTADAEGKIQLTFELTGIGEAYIDNVKIWRIVPRTAIEQTNVEKIEN